MSYLRDQVYQDDEGRYVIMINLWGDQRIVSSVEEGDRYLTVIDRIMTLLYLIILFFGILVFNRTGLDILFLIAWLFIERFLPRYLTRKLPVAQTKKAHPIFCIIPSSPRAMTVMVGVTALCAYGYFFIESEIGSALCLMVASYTLLILVGKLRGKVAKVKKAI